MTKDGWECITFPIIDLVAMGVPRTLVQIRSHGEGRRSTSEPFGSIRSSQRSATSTTRTTRRRRAARQTIAAHFAMMVGEPLAVVEEPGGRTMPGASIVKTMVLA